MRSKKIAAGALLLATALAASACGGGSNNNSGSASPSGSSSPSGAASPSAAASPSGSGQSNEKVTLKMMHLWPEESSAGQYKVVSQIISEYESAHPNVKIETEILENEQYKAKLKVLSASNNLPDIGFTWAAGFMEPYVKGNMFAPLNDLLSGELNGKFVSGTTEAYSFNGNTYALPVELNIVPVYYNKEIFAKNNLQPPKTIDDLKNIIKTLNGAGVTPITLGGKDAWTASFWYMYLADRLGGPTLLDQSVANNTFSDPALLDAAKELQGLVDAKAFVKGFNGLSNDEAKAEFLNEKAAMYAMGTWEVPNFTTNPDIPQAFKDKVGFFSFPVANNDKSSPNNWIGGPGVGIFASQSSKHPEEAKDFINFFVQKWGEHSVTDAGIIPATKVDTASIKLPSLFIDLLNELNSASKVTLYLDVQMKPGAAQEHYNLVQALLGKAITPEEFVKKQEEALKAGK